MKRISDRTIKACIDNGTRLIEEAEWHSHGPSPTGLALAILAQEEFSKASILHLVNEGAIPWTPEIQRSIRNHECKQLMTLIMDWLYSPIEEQIERIKSWIEGNPHNKKITEDVANAINIYRHEKIGKNSSEPEWNGDARKIAKGSWDRKKQNALYVSVGADGNIKSVPSVTEIEVMREIEQAKKFKEFIQDAHGKTLLVQGEYKHIKDIFMAMFADLESKDMINEELAGRAHD